MSDELDRVTHALRNRVADVSRSSDYIAELLSTTVCAAANRALTVAPNLSSELVLQGIVFTVERELANSSGIIRAQAHPLADPLGASLDLAVRGLSTVSVAVEVFAGHGPAVATASVEYAIRARPAA
jgi:hypothetical protein